MRDRLKPRPQLTLRLRLTLLYGSMFILAGAVLLAITYGLVAQSLPGGGGQEVVARAFRGNSAPTPKGGFFFTQVQNTTAVPQLPPDLPQVLRSTASKLAHAAGVQVTEVRNSQLSSLLTKSTVALGIMAILSIGLGWWMAGRALRPLRTMSQRAREITEDNLHERLGIEPRKDELGELAGSFDQLLSRLQLAFDSQRRFVANASHELRTPVTLQRTLIEVALADPDVSAESLRECCERVVVAGERQERLIESMLTLARSQAGIDVSEPVDLGGVAADVVRARDGENQGVRVEAALEPAPTSGDRALVERLIANLLDNAVAYNAPHDGWVKLSTGMRNGCSTLRVSNSGAIVPADRADQLCEPFVRLGGQRLATGGGLGLGLSVVSAIATAHSAVLDARPRPDGGLDVEVAFPAAS